MKFSLVAMIGFAASAFAAPVVEKRTDVLSILTGLVSDVKVQTALISEFHPPQNHRSCKKQHR
jgi:hypothetical protein